MADAADLKSEVERRVGSNPTGGTIDILQEPPQPSNKRRACNSSIARANRWAGLAIIFFKGAKSIVVGSRTTLKWSQL